MMKDFISMIVVVGAIAGIALLASTHEDHSCIETDSLGSFIARELIEACEVDLPRNQTCKLIAVIDEGK